ncbi:MAG: glycosyltransferase family 2 protein [Rikenellaceae bacterium]
MKSLHIITPVKDSIDSTLESARAIMNSKLTTPYIYTIYNDFSLPESRARLEAASAEMGFELVNLEDITTNPSPNYLLVLKMAQKRAIEAEAGVLIVESDVVVKEDTLQSLFDGAMQREDCGIAATVTVDDQGEINYPYLYAKGRQAEVYDESKHLSFCCSLLTLRLLKAFDFNKLDPTKNWHDVTISHKSLEVGCKNYLFVNQGVIHRPHGSRPWKQLKYSNPLKYYWLRFTKGLDKI